jgi:hypothetical protein
MKIIHKFVLVSLAAPLMFLSCKDYGDALSNNNGKVLLKVGSKVYVSTIPGDTIPNYIIDFNGNDWGYNKNLDEHKRYIDIINLDDSVMIYDIRLVKLLDVSFRAQSGRVNYLSITKVNGVPIYEAYEAYEKWKFSKEYITLRDSVEKSK